jgi:hypothetical protein
VELHIALNNAKCELCRPLDMSRSMLTEGENQSELWTHQTMQFSKLSSSSISRNQPRKRGTCRISSDHRLKVSSLCASSPEPACTQGDLR